MTRRALPNGYELDDARDRVDVAEVHRFLSTEAYWALGRERDHVERLVREASRVGGLTWRTCTSCRSTAGPASASSSREMVENGPYAGRNWILHTVDMHRLYAKLGFGPPGPKLVERPRPGS